MDRLEEYIRKNRESLDIREPSPEVWGRIEKDLKPVRRPFRRWMSVAASLIIVIGLSFVFYQLGRYSARSKSNSANMQLSLRQQLNEAEAYYTSQINALYLEAEPMLTANPDLQAELNSDIAQIDSIYTELRSDLKDNIANQEVVEALIRNYTIKIQILEDMLIILKEDKINGEKDKSYEL